MTWRSHSASLIIGFKSFWYTFGFVRKSFPQSTFLGLAGVLMELVLLLHREGCVAPSHIPREFNTWADELSHPDFAGYAFALRLETPTILFQLFLATCLLDLSQLANLHPPPSPPPSPQCV